MKVRVSDDYGPDHGYVRFDPILRPAEPGDESLLGEYVVEMPEDLFHAYERAREEHIRLAEEVAKLCRGAPLSKL